MPVSPCSTPPYALSRHGLHASSLKRASSVLSRRPGRRSVAIATEILIAAIRDHRSREESRRLLGQIVAVAGYRDVTTQKFFSHLYSSAVDCTGPDLASYRETARVLRPADHAVVRALVAESYARLHSRLPNPNHKRRGVVLRAGAPMPCCEADDPSPRTADGSGVASRPN